MVSGPIPKAPSWTYQKVGRTKNRFNKAIIISGDNDLAPAIHAAKELYPTKQIGVIVPIDRMPTRNLKTAAHFHHRMTEQHLQSAQLPDEIKFGENVIRKPNDWKLIPI